MSQPDYDVIIVGAGPAGIFAALELTRTASPRVLMLDKGPSLEKRRCPSREYGRCMKCATCHLMTGWGGSGAFSDGKLTLTTQVGGLLDEIRGVAEAEALVREVDAIWVRFGADGEPHSGDLDRIEEVSRRAALAGLRLQHYPIRHLGTERSGAILGAMYDEVVARGVEVRFRTDVARVLTRDGTAAGVETAKGETITARHVILAPGREGADWLTRLARDLELSLSVNPVDIGVRVEMPAHVFAPLTDLLYEPKFIYFSDSFDDRVRTFCLPGDQLFYCKGKDGEARPKRLADYRPDDLVLTYDFERMVFRFTEPEMYTCRQYDGPVYRIKVAGNGVIETTRDHLFFVAQEQGYVLKRAEELEQGDLLPVARDFAVRAQGECTLNLVELFQDLPSEYVQNLYARNTNRLVRELSTRHRVPMTQITQRQSQVSRGMAFSRLVEVYQEYSLDADDMVDIELGYMGSRSTLPAILPMSPALGRLLGFFVSEGNYNIHPERMRWFVAFTAEDTDVRKCILDDFGQVFQHATYHIVNEQDTRRGTQVFCTSKLACALFKHTLGIGDGAAQKCLPIGVSEWPEETLWAFLSGLMSGDGTISVDGTVAYSTVSSQLAQELAYLLHSLGIPARFKLSPKTDGAHFGPYSANHDLWQLRVRGIRAKQKLLQGLDLVKKDHKARAIKILHQDASYSSLVQVPRRVHELHREHIMHVPIRELESYEFHGPVFDFVLPETENFVAGQLPFVVHNCVCPYGEVVTEWAGDVLTVNGHSYAEQKTENSNFAVLVSKNFTEPFREPIAYGKYVARLANLLSGGIMVQRLGDLRAGRRTTEQRLERCITRPTLKEATPGDLNLVLPYRYVVNILEMLDALDQVAPGVASRHTLLYGVEAKFYSSRLALTRDLETQVGNLFAAGDGAGVTRGLVQASASGLVAAREILRRL